LEKELKESKEDLIWMTADEVATYLRLSKRVIYNLTSSRCLPVYKLGNRIRFLKSEIDELMRSRKVSA
jgi:excisionase family DNA binding protein